MCPPLGEKRRRVPRRRGYRREGVVSVGILAARSKIAFGRRYRVVVLGGFHGDLVEAALGVGLVGRIGDQVLIAQVLGNQVVDRLQIIFLAGIVGVAAGAIGDLLHDLSSVDAGIAGAAVTAAPAAAVGISAARIPAAARISTTSTPRVAAAAAAVFGIVGALFFLL